MLNRLNQTKFADNSLLLWAFVLGGALLGFLVVADLLRLLAKRARKVHGPTARPVLALLLVLIKATRYWLISLLALVIAGEFLHTSAKLAVWLDHLVFALCGLQFTLWANALIRYWLHRRDIVTGGSVINPVFLNMLTWAARILVWSMLLLAFLANVGVNITAFVASLGVGGIAIALALQNILGDLFASVAIGLDKPFEVGNFIAFGDYLGTVVHVGVKTTRIASLSGEELVISNSSLLKELIHNYSRMPQRRVVFGFRLPYTTRAGQVQSIITRTRTFIEAEEKTRLDRGHLTAFGEYGFDFEFVYYALAADFTLYRDIQQRANFRIMEQPDVLQVPFAVPVRSIFPHNAKFPTALRPATEPT